MTESTFKTPTFATIEELKSGKIEVVTQYRLTWKNFLIITRYGEEQTFVLLSNGERVIIDQPLKVAMREFSTVNHCYSRCSVPYYELLGEHHPIRAYVAGRNLLVPSMGTQNAEMVYYMVKPMTDHYFTKDQQGMILAFETPQLCVNVRVPAYQKKFEKILHQANAISQMHLTELHETVHRYGLEQECGCYGNQDYEQAQLTARAFEIKRHVYGYVLNTLHERLYGERLSDEAMQHLLEVLFDTFKR
ncbi:hypothetical protein [uncultured Limosilactobacillus sp.]|uniref:hypothetical protein n=1 Tax=uncultured Limosilactobacillus sp. TaxID=2837629 RepID=UPI0025D6A11A|nr:hypothetical protein [uncultured Limosilactobacillus sp.]